MSYRRKTLAGIAVLGLAGAGALAAAGGGGGGEPAQPDPTLGRIQTVALTTQLDCDALLRYYRTNAARMVGPYGLGGGGVMLATDLAMRAAASAEKAPNPVAGAANDAAPPDSGTNVQVSGVDESDIVKAAGDLMVAVVNGEVRITRLAGAQTTTVATWKPAAGSAQSVLLEGTTAVVIGDRSSGAVPNAADAKLRAGSPTDVSAVLTVLDLRDPSEPVPVREISFDGNRSGEARMVDGELRMALTAGPRGLAWKQPDVPSYDGGDDLKSQREAQKRWQVAEKKATAANREIVAASTIDNWIPQVSVTELGADGEPSGPADRRPALDCRQVAVPSQFSGLETLVMVATDLRTDAPLTTRRTAGVIAGGSTLYATADHAWLATSRWEELPTGDAIARWRPTAATTQIHLFDTPRGGSPRYVASGEVKGTLLNQFALDERDGVLRVASTTEGTARDDADREAREGEGSDANPGAQDGIVPPPATRVPATEARVTTLRPDGDDLAQVGMVGGLGRGESIRGVRFIDDVGYVVTFRQTDPLYTVDLSDPENPRVRGELKIPGYSAYLHPLPGGRLLGLGQDGTARGRTTGLQLSLFDVADITDPRRIDTQGLPDAWSDAEGDHHAFTLAGDLALVPYTKWDTETASGTDGPAFTSRYDSGVIALRVGGDELGTPDTLRPIADGPVTIRDKQMSKRLQQVTQAGPMRTVVRGGVIYTLTGVGVAAHDGTDFHRLTFAPF